MYPLNKNNIKSSEFILLRVEFLIGKVMFCNFIIVANELENVINPRDVIIKINKEWWYLKSISVKPINEEDNPPKPLNIATIWGRFGKLMRDEIKILVIAPKKIIRIIGRKCVGFKFIKAWIIDRDIANMAI